MQIPILQTPFYFENPLSLAKFFQVDFFELERLINNPQYFSYDIPKKRGGIRAILAPEKALKKVQKKLNFLLQEEYAKFKPLEVTGFIRSKGIANIVLNATPHIGKRQILNIDLENYFPNITASMVFKMFSNLFVGCDKQITTALALLCTFNGRLPQGAPSSPIISNLVCYNMDLEIINYVIGSNITYTRYADDLTFSSGNTINKHFEAGIRYIICSNGFKINEKKVHYSNDTEKQTVTGIVVNEKVNVDRKYIRKIRAMLYDLRNNGLEKATVRHFEIKGAIDDCQKIYFLNRLKGLIEFIGQVRGVNDFIYRRLRIEYFDFVELCDFVD